MNIVVLIPSYNESASIGGIVKSLVGLGYKTYVVDDGSEDKTAEIAEKEGATVFRHAKNMGKGSALREGFGRLLKEDFDAMLVMDGDGQHHIEDIWKLIARMEETDADIIIGDRMCCDTSNMPYVRKKTNHFMSWLVSKVAGTRVSDSQSGFRLIKKRVIESVKLESSNYEIESEMIIKAARKNFRIEAAPIRIIYENEESKINPIVDTIRFFIFLFKMLKGR